MVASVLFSDRPGQWSRWQAPLTAALASQGVEAVVSDRADDPAGIDYVVYSPEGGLRDFRPFSRLKAVLATWAGVETIVGNPTITVPLTRMVDPGMTMGMSEYVIGHLMRVHLGLDSHVRGQDGVWRSAVVPPLASQRGVTVLGLGELGGAVARAAAGLGFRTAGWSRRPKAIDGIECHHGDAGLDAALANADTLVLLLPDTPATTNVMDARRIACLPRGAHLINPGRGPLIDDEALLAALDAGHLEHATLDVFRQEPLPPGHPFWAHPKVTVTPHVASATRPESAAAVIAANIARAERGEPLHHLVDRKAGY